MTADGGPASSLRSDPALQALDAIHLAAVVLDVRAVVVHCNHFANRILAADEGLELDGEGCLMCRNPSDNRRLQAAIDAAIGSPGQELPRKAGLISLSRRSGSTPYFVRAVPVSAHFLQVASVPRGAILLVADPDAPARHTAPHLQSLFGLTQAESLVCAGLLEGHSYQEIALLRGVSSQTVKTHARSVLRKTGMRNRHALMQIEATLGRLLSAGLPLD